MGKRLARLRTSDGRETPYLVVAYYHEQPDGSLQWVDWRKPAEYVPRSEGAVCDECGQPAEWFGNGERRCEKHAAGRKGRG